MKNFKRLIIQGIALQLLFFILIVLIQGWNLSSLMSLKQQHQQDVLSQLGNTSMIQDDHLLARHIRQSANFDYLKMEVLEPGTSAPIYLYEDNEQAGLTHALLARFSMLPTKDSVALQNKDVRIIFRLSVKQPIAQLEQTLLWIFITFSGFTLSFSLLAARTYHKQKKRDIHALSLAFAQLDNDPGAEIEIPAPLDPIAQAITGQYALIAKEKLTLDETKEEIRAEAYTDPLTGLSNRQMFIYHVESHLDKATELEFGILALVRCGELQLINKTHGYKEGDTYLKRVADILIQVSQTYEKSRLFRIAGADFCLLLPNITPKEAERLGNELKGKFNELQQTTELDGIAHTGMVKYEAGRPLGELLALADTALSVAQTKYPNAWHVQNESSMLDADNSNFGNQSWRELIDDVIDYERVTLHAQPIQATKQSTRSYKEVLARFTTDTGHPLPTASFFAMAEKLEKIVDIDKLIVNQTLQTIEGQKSQNSFAINLSSHSIQDEHFVIWLERRLLRHTNLSSRVIFELSEYALIQNIAASKRFIDMVHRVGSRITVEKFGLGITSFKFFRDLSPDFVKMDGSYTRGIANDKNTQYFLRLVIDLAHKLGIQVIAECVEAQEEKHMLESMLIDGLQGYHIGKPEAIS